MVLMFSYPLRLPRVESQHDVKVQNPNWTFLGLQFENSTMLHKILFYLICAVTLKVFSFSDEGKGKFYI